MLISQINGYIVNPFTNYEQREVKIAQFTWLLMFCISAHFITAQYWNSGNAISLPSSLFANLFIGVFFNYLLFCFLAFLYGRFVNIAYRKVYVLLVWSSIPLILGTIVFTVLYLVYGVDMLRSSNKDYSAIVSFVQWLNPVLAIWSFVNFCRGMKYVYGVSVYKSLFVVFLVCILPYLIFFGTMFLAIPGLRFS